MKATRTLANGARFTLNLDPTRPVHRVMHAAITSGAGYEDATEAFLVRTIQPHWTCWDIGAHIGYFTSVMAVCAPEGRVMACEPHPDNYQRLLQTCHLNGFRNVLPLNIALGHTSGRQDLWLNSDDDGGHALYNVGTFAANTKSRAHPEAHPVWVAKGDEFAPAPDLIKLDCEGAEHTIMQGLTHNPAFVISEIHRSGLELLGSTEAQYRHAMGKRGYTAYLPRPEGTLEPLGERTADGHYVFNVVFARG